MAAAAENNINQWIEGSENNINARLHNKLVVNYNKNTGEIFNARTHTRKGYHGYRRKKNMNSTKKRGMIRALYKRILKNDKISESTEHGLYNYIIRGSSLFSKSMEQIEQEVADQAITVYAAPVTNQQEIGSRHINIEELTRRIGRDQTPVWVGGEYMFINGEVYFNIHSGNYVYKRIQELFDEYLRVHPLRANSSQANIHHKVHEMYTHIIERVVAIFKAVGISSKFYPSPEDKKGFQIIRSQGTWMNQPNAFLDEYYNRIEKNEINQEYATRVRDAQEFHNRIERERRAQEEAYRRAQEAQRQALEAQRRAQEAQMRLLYSQKTSTSSNRSSNRSLR